MCLLILFLKNDLVAIIFTLFSQKLSELIGGFGVSCENVLDVFFMTGTQRYVVAEREGGQGGHDPSNMNSCMKKVRLKS